MYSVNVQEILLAVSKVRQCPVVYLETDCVDISTKSSNYWAANESEGTSSTLFTKQTKSFAARILTNIVNASCQLDHEYDADQLFEKLISDSNDRDVILNICRILIDIDVADKDLTISATYKGVMTLEIKIIFPLMEMLSIFKLVVEGLIEKLQKVEAPVEVATEEKSSGKAELSNDVGADDTDSEGEDVFAESGQATGSIKPIKTAMELFAEEIGKSGNRPKAGDRLEYKVVEKEFKYLDEHEVPEGELF